MQWTFACCFSQAGKEKLLVVVAGHQFQQDDGICGMGMSCVHSFR